MLKLGMIVAATVDSEAYIGTLVGFKLIEKRLYCQIRILQENNENEFYIEVEQSQVIPMQGVKKR